MLCLHAVTDEDGHPLEDEDESGMRLRTCWCKIFEALTEGERHHYHETTLEFVQKAPDDIQWETDKREFHEMMATKNPLPDLTGFPLAGGVGLLVLVRRVQVCV